jgi:hypothetical protein
MCDADAPPAATGDGNESALDNNATSDGGGDETAVVEKNTDDVQNIVDDCTAVVNGTAVVANTAVVNGAVVVDNIDAVDAADLVGSIVGTFSASRYRRFDSVADMHLAYPHLAMDGESVNTATIAELFLLFFDFYVNRFDFDHMAVSIRCGQAQQRSDGAYTQRYGDGDFGDDDGGVAGGDSGGGGEDTHSNGSVQRATAATTDATEATATGDMVLSSPSRVTSTSSAAAHATIVDTPSRVPSAAAHATILHERGVLFVEDVFEPRDNAARSVSRDGRERILAEFETALRVLLDIGFDSIGGVGGSDDGVGGAITELLPGSVTVQKRVQTLFRIGENDAEISNFEHFQLSVNQQQVYLEKKRMQRKPWRGRGGSGVGGGGGYRGGSSRGQSGRGGTPINGRGDRQCYAFNEGNCSRGDSCRFSYDGNTSSSSSSGRGRGRSGMNGRGGGRGYQSYDVGDGGSGRRRKASRR